jgi:hypothetical protein
MQKRRDVRRLAAAALIVAMLATIDLSLFEALYRMLR